MQQKGKEEGRLQKHRKLQVLVRDPERKTSGVFGIAGLLSGGEAAESCHSNQGAHSPAECVDRYPSLCFNDVYFGGIIKDDCYACAL